jgi:hypothetical protein
VPLQDRGTKTGFHFSQCTLVISSVRRSLLQALPRFGCRALFSVRSADLVLWFTLVAAEPKLQLALSCSRSKFFIVSVNRSYF